MGSFEAMQVFSLRAPASRVHEAVTQPETWLTNCGVLRELRLVREGSLDGPGPRHRAVLQVSPGYAITWELETVRSLPGRLVAWEASGDIEGYGLWELEERSNVTQVATTWDVRPTQPWMGLLSPLTRGLIANQHDALMREGVRALAAHLDAELVSELSVDRPAGLACRGVASLAGVAGTALRRHRQHA